MRTMLAKAIAVGMLSAAAVPAMATTYHTMTVQTFPFNPFDPDELFPTSTPLPHHAYVTWNADNLYFGHGGEPGFPGLPNHRMAWYIDTDPQPVPLSGNGTRVALAAGTQNWKLPFFADYAMTVSTLGGFVLRRWDGAQWGSTSNAGIFVGTTSAPEEQFRVLLPRVLLGDPARTYILGFLYSEEPGAETTYASWPDDALVGGDGYKPKGELAHWWGYPVVAGIAPNDPSFHDQTLPVELQSFVIE